MEIAFVAEKQRALPGCGSMFRFGISDDGLVQAARSETASRGAGTLVATSKSTRQPG
jgi:hypothetical protein